MARLTLAGALAVLIAVAAAHPPVVRAEASNLPPIRHVWVIVLENSSFNKVSGNSPFNTPGWSPYLANVLTKQGNLLTQYWGTAHNSLPNYLAMVSGQSPTPDTQSDCLVEGDLAPGGAPTDAHGQAIGQGCTYPANVRTLADQLSANGFSWRGYMQDLRDSTANDGSGCPSRNGNNPGGIDQYVKKHDPFQWFHSIIDNQSLCMSHDLPLTQLAQDLQNVRTTPNFSFISPGLYDDGHEGFFPRTADPWLRQYVPMIMSSPAYRQDGMIVITFDESETVVGVPVGPEDDQACCAEIPGPNSPDPGVVGPGGGRTGAVVLSPFVRPGTKDDPSDPTRTGPGFYNHYSFLRSMEDLFGIDSGGDDGHGHLGFAGTYLDHPGPGSFGADVYNNYDGSPASPAASEPPAGPTGPRRADGSATWQHPLPQGSDLEGIACPTVSTCFAVGDAGAILGSTDGGDIWTLQRSGSVSHLRAISCANAQSCVAVGDGGAVLVTADGGERWSRRPSGSDAALNGVSCPTASTCVLVGDSGTILRSEDGGASWADQTSSTQQPLYGVSCPTESACFAVGRSGAVVTTTDGSVWSLRTLLDSLGAAQRLWSVSCTDASTCIAAGDGRQIWRTVDGGTSWADRSATPRTDQYRGVSCPSSNLCVVAGEQGSAGGNGANDAAAVVTTTNGGTSWTRPATHSTNILRAVSCPSTTTCLAVGVRGSILRSSDGGAGWSSRSPGADAELSRIVCTSIYQCLPEGMNALEGASCPDLSTCFAVGTYRTIMATGDGGETWATQTSGAPQENGSTSPPLPPAGLNSISCPSIRTCYAVGDIGVGGAGTILATADGGSNWSDQSSGVPSDLLGLSCPTDTACFAVGGNGTILHTTTSGASWSQQSVDPGTTLSDVSCANATLCVAVGSFGTVLTTRDHGAHWSRQATGTSSYLDGVSCPKPSICLAVGSAGTVLGSADGGQTWSRQSPGVGDDLRSIACSDASHCLATGSLGTLISTADGGESWFVQGTGTRGALRAATCPTAASPTTASCIAAGDAGAILRVVPSATPKPHPVGPPAGGGSAVSGPGAEGHCAHHLAGTSGPDQLTGTLASDLLQGLRGRDRLRGLAGDDCAFGGDGSDRIDGGPGDDLLVGGAGPDRIRGGPGDDRIRARGSASRHDIVNCGAGRDRVTADSLDVLRNCEQVRITVD